MRWLFLFSSAADGPYNMALDEALMRRAARTQDAVFRVYAWSQPTLSFGRNQRARDCYDLAASDARKIRFVRRPTGGRALLHYREVTYSVTLPVNNADEARSVYHFINSVLIEALRRIGVPATAASATQSLTPGLRPCFDVPAEYEIVVHGRKLVGSAQWRSGGAVLQHGSILIRDDQRIISELLFDRPVSVVPQAATLADALGYEPCIEDLGQPLLQSLQSHARTTVESLTLEHDLLGEVARLRGTYSDGAWTWRR